MEFFNNKSNDSLKFQINTEGADLNKIEARLIFSTKENINYLVFGKIQEDKCIFDIPELKIFEQGDQGNIKFEIITQDLYFPVWEEKFEIKTKVNITFEKLISNIQSNTEPTTKTKPKISVSTPIKENKPEILKETKTPEKDITIPTIEGKSSEIKNEEAIKNFSSFFNKNK